MFKSVNRTATPKIVLGRYDRIKTKTHSIYKIRIKHNTYILRVTRDFRLSQYYPNKLINFYSIFNFKK